MKAVPSYLKACFKYEILVMKYKTAVNSKACAILGLVIFSLGSLLGVTGQAAVNERKSASSSGRIPVIFDTDIGSDIDDTWALGMILKCPELDVRLITGDHGKQLYRAKLIGKFLERIGRTDIPIGIGKETDEKGEGPQADWVRDYDLGRYPGRVHRDGVQAIIDTILGSQERVTIVATGPIPNIAAALEREPRIARQARFIGMQGCIYKSHSSRKQPKAEHNVRANIDACRKVFTAPWDVTIIPLDTSGFVRLRNEKYRRIWECGSPTVRAILENYRIWAKNVKWARISPEQLESRSTILFDTVAVYLAFSEELVKMERLPITVNNEGYTVVDPAGKPMNVATEWEDLAAFEDLLVERLTEPSDEALVAPSVESPLVVHPDNPRYLMVKGDPARRAVFLSGSHTWAEFQTYKNEEFDYIDWLDKLVAWNHNFMRGWMWEDDYYSPIPYAKSGDKYDLTKYNPVYFDRLKRRIREADKRGIYMSVMLFEGWSVLGPDRGRRPVPWPRHPYHVNNNINGIDGDPDGNGNGYEVHTLKIPKVTRLQEAYVKHFIDELNGFDNIIWEIGNECNAESAAWQYHMIDFIKSCEATKPKQHLVWINLGKKEVFAPQCHADIVSPGGDQTYLHNPPRAAGNKVVIADSDHLSPLRVTHVQFWKWFTRGMHPILMDCKYQGLSWWTGRSFQPEHVKWGQMRDAMGVIRGYADRMNLVTMVPQDEMTDSPSSTRYCLYEPGREYLVYQPRHGEFRVRLPAGRYGLEWFNPSRNKVAGLGTIDAITDQSSFTPPFEGHAVIYLKALDLRTESN